MSKLNIRKENCRFIVNEEKRTVICIIDETRALLYNFVDSDSWNTQMRIGSITFEPDRKLLLDLMLPDKFIGKAVCSKDDKWDPEVGKLIAFDRAKNKLHSAFFKRAQLFSNEIDKSLTQLVTSFNEYGEQLSKSADKRAKKIEELTKE